MLSGVVHACRAWGRTQVWMQTNRDRYGNEDGWAQSIAGRLGQAISAGAAGTRPREVMSGDALAVSAASRGMPEMPYRVLFIHYVVVKGLKLKEVRVDEGSMLCIHEGKTYEVARQRIMKVPDEPYRIPVKTKARELGIGTNDYYKHLNGAHMWLAARLDIVRTK
jgi:hypothetical protein